MEAFINPHHPPKKKRCFSCQEIQLCSWQHSIGCSTKHTQGTPYDRLPTGLSYRTFRTITYSRVNVIFVLNISKNLLSCLQRDSVNMDQQVNTTECQNDLLSSTYRREIGTLTIMFLFFCVTSFTKSSYWPEFFSVSCLNGCLLSTCWVIQNLANLFKRRSGFLLLLFFLFLVLRKRELKGAFFPHLTRNLQKHLLLVGSGWRCPLCSEKFTTTLWYGWSCHCV